MTLFDLKSVKFNLMVDFYDDEIDVHLPFCFEEIPDEVAKEIEVVSITMDAVICRFTNYLRRQAIFHPSKIRRYISNNYENKVFAEEYANQMTKTKVKNGDITDDGGALVYYFISYDFKSFLKM